MIINPNYSYLGASPDGAVYDPSNMQEPYEFLEIKSPYTYRNVYRSMRSKWVYCKASDGKLILKESHQYYAQVQGQMAGFDTGFFAREGETVFLKKFWIFSDSRTAKFSYNNFSNSIFIGYRPV